MARVDFDPGGDLRVRAPVEVRDRDLVVAGHCVAGGAGIDLPPGIYHAFATYPDGDTAHAAFEVAEGDGSKHVLLRGQPEALPEPDGASGRAKPVLGIVGRIMDAVRRSSPAEEKAVPRAHRARALSWHGDPLLGVDDPVTVASDESNLLEPRTAPWLAQVEVGHGQVNVIVPGMTALRLPDPGERALPLPAFEDPDLATAVALYSRGLLRQVATIGRAAGGRAYRAGAQRHAWAYLLLAVGDFRTVETIVAHAAHDAPTPDEAVLRASMFARNGEHKAALHALLKGLDGGVPAFAPGLLRAVEHLRLYASAEDLDDNGEAFRVLAVLRPYASALVAGAVLTTYHAHAGKPEPAITT